MTMLSDRNSEKNRFQKFYIDATFNRVGMVKTGLVLNQMFLTGQVMVKVSGYGKGIKFCKGRV